MATAWQEQGRSRARAEQEQGRSRAGAGAQYQPPYKISSKFSVKHKVERFHHWLLLVGQSGWSKNSRGYILLIQYCFLANISPYAKFDQNQKKN